MSLAKCIKLSGKGLTAEDRDFLARAGDNEQAVLDLLEVLQGEGQTLSDQVAEQGGDLTTVLKRAGLEGFLQQPVGERYDSGASGASNLYTTTSAAPPDTPAAGTAVLGGGLETAPETPASPPAKIDDFGEKIGGAAKDAYQKSLEGKLPDEDKNITLAKHFPEPDYQKLANEGVPVDQLAMVKAMRDSIGAKPRKAWKLKTWADGLRELRGFAETLLSGQMPVSQVVEAMEAPQYRQLKTIKGDYELLLELGFPEQVSGLKGYSLRNVHFQTFRGQENVDKWELKPKSAAKSLGGLQGARWFDDRAEAVAQLKRALNEDAPGAKSSKGVKFDAWTERGVDGIFIGKKVRSGKYIELARLPSSERKNAHTYIREHQAELEELLAKRKTIPMSRRERNAARVGTDHRKGENISPERFSQAFGFRGVEFGNYVENTRRQSDLNNAFDGLNDLAGLLGIPSQAVSLNGELGMAFGARGKGGKGAAAAHYERDKVVINLTKRAGPGSLAHEWFHALDNYMARARGQSDEYMTDSPRPRLGRKDSDYVDPTRVEVLDAWAALRQAVTDTDMVKRSRQLDGRRTKDYWSTPIELLARAFERYIVDTADGLGHQNDYLANIVDPNVWAAEEALFQGNEDVDTYPYPTDEEAAGLNKAFDDLFKVLEHRTTDTGEALFNMELSPIGFYSALTENARQLKTKGTPERLLAQLKKRGGVSQKEIEWTGLKEWMAAQNGDVSSDAMADYLEANGVVVDESVLLGPEGGTTRELRFSVGSTDTELGSVQVSEQDRTLTVDRFDVAEADADMVIARLKRLATEGNYDRLEWSDSDRKPVAITPKMKRVAVEEGMALFANASGYRTKPGRGMNIATAERVAKPLLDGIARETGLQVQVIHSQMIPPEIAAQVPEGHRPKAYIIGRRMTLLADTMRSPAEVRKSIAHEVIGHMGINAVVGDGWPALQRRYQIMKRGGNASFKAIHGELVKRYGAKIAGDADTELREFIAVAAEGRELRGPLGRWMDTVRSAVNKGLRRMGFATDFGMNDINDLLRQSEKYIRTGRVSESGVPNPGGNFEPTVDEEVAFELEKEYEQHQADAIRHGGMGTQTRGQTFRQRMDQLRDNFKVKARQYWIDPYDSIRTVVKDEASWMKAHLTKSTHGALEASFQHGQAYLHQDGVLAMDRKKKGLMEIMAPLEADVDRFMYWIAGNRSDKLMKEGRENLFEQHHIDALKSVNQDGVKGKPGYRPGREALFNQVRKEFEAYQDSWVQIAVDSGLVDQAEADVWRNEGFYIPFYRVLDEEENVQGPRVMTDTKLVKQQAYQRLKGGVHQLDDLLSNALMNWDHLAAASLKNLAARGALESAEQMGLASSVDANGKPLNSNSASKDAVFVRVDGKPKYYELDTTVSDGQVVLQSLVAMNWNGFKGPIASAARAAKRYLTGGVTASPEFKIANMIRDTMQAVAVGDMSTNIFKNIWQGAKATRPDSDAAIQMMASGAIFPHTGYIHGADPEAIRYQLKKNVKRDTILDSRNAVIAMWDRYQQAGARLENVNRAANYVQALDAGRDLLSASFEARDHVDFSRQGAGQAARVLTSSVAFLNARIQGLDKLARAMADPNQRKQFFAVVGAYSAASVMLYLHMKDDEDYVASEDWERDTYHLFKLPGSDTMYRLPRPFEVGAIANMVERATEQLVNDEVHGGIFGQRLLHTLVHTFSFDMPTIMLPLWEVNTDKNSFTGRGIEGWGMRGPNAPSPHERKRAYTSEFAIGVSSLMAKGSRGLGEVVGKHSWDGLVLSPLQLQHLTQGYFGWAGTTVLSGLDYLTREVQDLPSRPARHWSESPVIKRFVKAGVPRNTRYMTELYELRDEISKVAGDVNYYRRMRDSERANELREKNRDVLRVRKSLDKRARRISDLNMRKTLITKDRELTPEEKRAALEALDVKRNDIAEETVKMAKQRLGR